MSDEIETLYAKLTAGRRRAVRDRPVEERRAYVAQRVREHRQRQREAVQAGSPLPTEPMIREALADAALALLAVDGPGSDQIKDLIDPHEDRDGMGVIKVTIPSMETFRKEACHVLFVLDGDQELGIQPGSFTEGLIRLMAIADADNRQRLGIMYPAISANIEMYKTRDDGVELLRAAARRYKNLPADSGE